MNISVLLFFLNNVFATLLIGSKFSLRKEREFKTFGIGLIFIGIAFVIWSLAVATQTLNLERYITWGGVFFIISLIFFVFSSQESKLKQPLIWLSIFGGLILLYLRAFVYPSNPGFSEQGFFFFNTHPVIQMFYIFALLLATIPAIDNVSQKLKSPYEKIFRYGFIIEVAGGIILLTSNINNPDTLALNITGWIIATVYLLLLSIFFFDKRVWE